MKRQILKMDLKFSKWTWLILLLTATLLLGACGDEEEPSVQSASSNRPTATTSDSQTAGNDETGSADSPLAQLPEPIDGQVSLPVIDSISGGLLFTQGYYGTAGTQLSTLYFMRFGETEAHMIAEGVNPTTVSVSPDYKKVFYSTSGVRNRRVFVADLTTLEATDLGRMQGVVANIVGWTPDSVLYAEIQIRGDGPVADFFLAKQDGSGVVDVSPEGVMSGVLADGTLLLNAVSEDQTALTLNRYDPATETSTEIGTVALDNENFGATILAIIDTLQTQGLDLSDTFFTNGSVRSGDDILLTQLASPAPGGVALCGLWEISKVGIPESTLVYSIEDATLLSHLRVLPDGSLLMLHWWLEDCNINELHNEILHVSTDGQSSVSVAEIDPGTEVNLSFLAGSSGQKYDVTPDGRYVLWIGGGLRAGYSAVNVTDLQTDTTATLMRQMQSGSADSFLENQIFSNVFWINTD
ncbi:MAG: hypothetical protein DPW16_16345 [Chloroflexi bacterium]|nr:hypothetical protein [Chloroflexota bacterium]